MRVEQNDECCKNCASFRGCQRFEKLFKEILENGGDTMAATLENWCSCIDFEPSGLFLLRREVGDQNVE